MIITHQELHCLMKDYSELSLDELLHAQLETEEVTTTEEPSEERTPAMQWIILDSIGTIQDF